MQRTAEIVFDHGRQLVRLPEDIHLESEQVLLRQDELTGDLILSPVKSATAWKTWGEFFRLLDEIGPIEDDILPERKQEPPSSRVDV